MLEAAAGDGEALAPGWAGPRPDTPTAHHCDSQVEGGRAEGLGLGVVDDAAPEGEGACPGLPVGLLVGEIVAPDTSADGDPLTLGEALDVAVADVWAGDVEVDGVAEAVGDGEGSCTGVEWF